MARRLGTVAWCLVFMLTARVWAQPQTPPSVGDTADRPGFADSPILLAPGQIQIESGFAWEREGRGGGLTKTFTWPQVEVHAGLTTRVEVSVASDGLVSTATAMSASNLEGRSTGWADVRLGAKFGLVNGPNVDSALIAYADLPVGSAAVSSGYADPLVRFAWGISPSDRLGLSGSVDLGAEREANDRVRPKPAASLSLETTVVERLNGFLGIVAESPPIGSALDVWSIEAGFVLPLGVRTQIDVSGSRRIAGGDRDWYVGAGFVYRLRSPGKRVSRPSPSPLRLFW